VFAKRKKKKRASKTVSAVQRLVWKKSFETEMWVQAELNQGANGRDVVCVCVCVCVYVCTWEGQVGVGVR
jgi:ribosomal protein L31E